MLDLIFLLFALSLAGPRPSPSPICSDCRAPITAPPPGGQLQPGPAPSL
jgi:hypothetical protein